MSAYGDTWKTQKKMAGKRDESADAEAQKWVEDLTKEKFNGAQTYDDNLRNGVRLCKLMNVLLPGSVKKIQESGGDFKMMENISNFQNAARAYGLTANDLFQTVDLWEKRNVAQVTQCIFALGRYAQIKPDYKGPILGPKMSEENKREFTEKQMRAGEGHIGLQAGQNKGATQAGMNPGKQRMVCDIKM